MKKIAVAVLAAAMLTSAAMADIGFSYTGSNYFTSSGGNLKYNHDMRYDCLAVTLSNDIGGIVVDFDVDGTALVEDEYYGWLNFDLPVGQLQVTAGVWNSRYVNRVLTDKGDLDAEDFELYKPGVINGSTGKDSDNITRGNIGTVAAWTLADALPGTLLVKLGLFKSAWNPDAVAADEDMIINAGFAGEIGFLMDGLLNANLAVRSSNKKNHSFGLWVSPLMAEGLQLTVGATVATVSSYNSTNKKWSDTETEWGIDLRARYQVTESLSITTMNNLSGAADSKTDGNRLILWDMLNCTLSLTERLTTALTIQSVCDGFDSDHKSACGGFDITVSPSLVIQATERARVTTALRMTWDDVNFTDGLKNISGGASFTIPVTFSYSF